MPVTSVAGADQAAASPPTDLKPAADGSSRYSFADGTCVWATLMTSACVDGEPTMYGLSAALPADATTTAPASDAFLRAKLRSSSSWP